ncbi:hypothetical protein, conserved [Eimeria tenella]|uniref:Tyrosine-protein kinase ephrin type A/B receptor-like domain-containing protein n=1 Tax=Eimeria tenella TaxID=5802 RepID=U6KZ26_EIMTE|nr:hypothetical protein, conserved [Eimeria tenella]CDJ42188.1 hypothetical protein, conserved [Eimeria tenella]|eukprot:XP_013232938.1 hypothetical protein, conserved [Eimeria tenella]
MKEALHLKTACPVQGGKTAALVGRQSSGTVQFLITALQAPRRSFLALLGLTGLVSEDQCTKCPPGKFCSMASSSSPSGNCEPGFVCYGGATIATPTDGITGAQCPRGGYCPAGADRVTPCPAGYYNPRAGGGSPSACIECPPGLYCDGTVVSEGGITGPCKEGYYCEAGSATATASEAPKGSYAPEGSSTYLLCNPGTFQNETGSASCLPCLAGTFCQRLVSPRHLNGLLRCS